MHAYIYSFWSSWSPVIFFDKLTCETCVQAFEQQICQYLFFQHQEDPQNKEWDLSDCF